MRHFMNIEKITRIIINLRTVLQCNCKEHNQGCFYMYLIFCSFERNKKGHSSLLNHPPGPSEKK